MLRSKPAARRKRTSVEAYFLDANIVMYAAGEEHPLRAPCRSALQRAVDRDAVLKTDSEVLQEILYRYFAIRKPDVARLVYHAVLDLCSEVFPVSESHTSRALAILLAKDTLSTRDAVHVAIMENHGIDRILSTDRHFDSIAGITRIPPAHFLA